MTPATMPAPPAPAPHPAAPPRRPFAGDEYVARTEAGQDVHARIQSVLRETDQQGVFTIRGDDRNLTWVRFDAVRGDWVRAVAQVDGGPVE